MTGREQFFDLERDPYERNDLAADPRAQDELASWRERLVAHLAPRGPAWVTDGKLMLRPTRQLHSPNYPG